jgi:DNA-binding NtrC family response regulator
LKGTPARAISEEAAKCLASFDWPGNVRELLHVIQRAAVLSGGEIIDAENLPESVRKGPPVSMRLADELETMPLREAIASLERRMILRALERASGNRSEAARKLGIARPQLYAKMEEHGIGGKGESTES